MKNTTTRAITNRELYQPCGGNIKTQELSSDSRQKKTKGSSHIGAMNRNNANFIKKHGLIGDAID